MSDIERYTGIGCPRIHLHLYNAVMRGHRLDETQMIMLFPLFLSGAAQRWFASLDSSGPRPLDVGTIGMMGHRSSRRPQTQRQFSDTSY